MQVANDVASANELPSREARPGRRVNNSAAAGKLQGGELREDCVGRSGAWSRWPRAQRSWRMRPAASRRATAAAVTAPRRALATLVSTSSGVILAAMSRECWSTAVLRP